MKLTVGGVCRECGRPFGFVPDYIERARERDGDPLQLIVVCRECFGKASYERKGRRPVGDIAEVVVELG